MGNWGTTGRGEDWTGNRTGFTTAPESFPAKLGSPAGTPAHKVGTTLEPVPFGG